MMNLLHELEAYVKVLQHSESTTEIAKARMNFIVNLVTILEVHSRTKVHDLLDDNLMDGDLTYNMICRATPDNHTKSLVRELTELRNKFIHEGKSTIISSECITTYYSLTKSLIQNK